MEDVPPILAMQIAAILSDLTGTAWAPDQAGGSPTRLIGPGGRLGLALHLRPEARLAISGVFGECNRDRPYPTPPNEISVHLARPPLAIAREIQRRLLPNYLPADAAARAAFDERQRRDHTATALLAELLELAGGGINLSQVRGGRRLEVEGAARRLAGLQIGIETINGESTVQLRCTVSPDTARAVIAMLRAGATSMEDAVPRA